MTITMLDTYPAIRTILCAPLEDRPALLRDMPEPAAGMYRYFPGEVDLVAMHRMSSGFPLDRDEQRCLEALDTLHSADAWGRIGRALDDALAVQLAATPGISVPDITVLVVPGDPADTHFMGPNLGMTANGSAPGYLFLNFWPYPENLARLEATAVHELNHNLRYSPGNIMWNPATVCLRRSGGHRYLLRRVVHRLTAFTASGRGDCGVAQPTDGSTPRGGDRR